MRGTLAILASLWALLTILAVGIVSSTAEEWDTSGDDTAAAAVLVCAALAAIATWLAFVWGRQGHRRHAAVSQVAGTFLLGASVLVAVLP